MVDAVLVPVFLFVVAFIPTASGKGFLIGGSQSNRFEEMTSDEIQTAMEAVMGCGDGIKREDLVRVERALSPMWRTLPKDEESKVKWQSLRYIAHRYFMQQSSLLVRGFEPVRLVNASHGGHADVLRKHVPHFVELMLEDKNVRRGFSLQDATALVVTLEKVIFESETEMLEEAYYREHVLVGQSLNRRTLNTVLETYLVHWLLGDDAESVEVVLNNRTILSDVFPHWGAILKYLTGQIHAYDFSRERSLSPRNARSTMLRKYTFEDAHEIVGSVTRTFASFWQSECRSIKTSLVSMDKSGTGRVPLSRFYNSGLTDEWRFGESEAYLRELGVLDESSVWRGKQVLITNYLQAASNCIVSQSHYHVCCANECEEILGEIEAKIGAPDALPGVVLEVVGNITSPSDDEDAAPKLAGRLTAQLMQLAQLHGGRVPLHSRLFAHWLHFAYPHECAIPHKAGAHSTATPTEFGAAHLATTAEMRAHASTDPNPSPENEEDSAADMWMSEQWSEAEEVVLADYVSRLKGTWGIPRSCTTVGGTAAFVFLAVWTAMKRHQKGAFLDSVPVAGTFEKSHMV